MVPPSCQDLVSRLHKRGEDDAKVIARRLQSALEEFEHYQEFDYLVVNRELEGVTEEVHAIIKAERLKVGRQEHHCAEILADLRKDMQKIKEGVDFN